MFQLQNLNYWPQNIHSPIKRFKGISRPAPEMSIIVTCTGTLRFPPVSPAGEREVLCIGPWLPLSLCVGHSGPVVEGLQASIVLEHTPFSARGSVVWKRLPLLTLVLKLLLLHPKHPLLQLPTAASIWESKGAKCTSEQVSPTTVQSALGSFLHWQKLWSSPWSACLILLLPSQGNNPIPPPDPRSQAPQSQAGTDLSLSFPCAPLRVCNPVHWVFFFRELTPWFLGIHEVPLLPVTLACHRFSLPWFSLRGLRTPVDRKSSK